MQLYLQKSWIRDPNYSKPVREQLYLIALTIWTTPV